jgi:hypothetical protein
MCYQALQSVTGISCTEINGDGTSALNLEAVIIVEPHKAQRQAQIVKRKLCIKWQSLVYGVVDLLSPDVCLPGAGRSHP